MRIWTWLGPVAFAVAVGCGDKEAGSDGTTGEVGTTDPAEGEGEGEGEGKGEEEGETDPDADGDGSPASEDCDDTNPDVYPFADEFCDGIDNDCDGDTDENTAVDAVRYYTDEDGDGYGSDENAAYACDPPSDVTVEGGATATMRTLR